MGSWMEVVYTSFSLSAARCLVCCFLPYSWPAAARSSLLTASHCFVLASCSLPCCYSFSCPSLSSCFSHCSGFLSAALCVVPLTPAQLLAQYVIQVIITTRRATWVLVHARWFVSIIAWPKEATGLYAVIFDTPDTLSLIIYSCYIVHISKTVVCNG